MAGVAARDGHIYKQLDTGESYLRRGGTWTFINLGLSFIKATKSGLITTNSSGFYQVTFTTPFISVDYTVQLTCSYDATNKKLVVAYKHNVLTTGFKIYTLEGKAKAVGNIEVAWLATRSYDP